MINKIRLMGMKDIISLKLCSIAKNAMVDIVTINIVEIVMIQFVFWAKACIKEKIIRINNHKLIIFTSHICLYKMECQKYRGIWLRRTIGPWIS